MTRYNVFELDEDKRKALLNWLNAEGLNAGEIANDGRFSVHNGKISGNRFLYDEEGFGIVIDKSNRAVKVPFNVPQKNPLPEGL